MLFTDQSVLKSLCGYRTNDMIQSKRIDDVQGFCQPSSLYCSHYPIDDPKLGMN